MIGQQQQPFVQAGKDDVPVTGEGAVLVRDGGLTSVPARFASEIALKGA